MKYVARIVFIIICTASVFSVSCLKGTSPSPSTVPASEIPFSSASSPSGTMLDRIRLVGTIGPMSLPLAYMVKNNSLESIARTTSLTLWSNPTQLQAIITSLQGDFVALPTNSSSLYYNKGISLQLLDCSIWNILYLVTEDTGIKSITDLKGKRIVIPYQGAIPDAMFRFVWQQYGLDPDKDIDIYYAPDPVQASQLLLLDQDKYVLLSEPSATSVILNGQANGKKYIRALNMEVEWKKASGTNRSTPIAGTVVLGALKDRPEIINTFINEYQKAVTWIMANPQEAGVIGEKVLADSGFTAPVLSDSMNNISWRFVRSQDARPDIESFFSALSMVSPGFIGGKLPDSGYYYGK
jgi:NitT/TauT family transport system substrate-binding protein